MKSQSTEYRQERMMLWVGLGIIGLVALAFNLANFDIAIQTRLYQPGAPDGPWPTGSIAVWDLLYRLGTIPGIAAGVGSILALGASFLSPRFLRLRYPALFLVLVMIIGPGLVVNGLGKGLWGRPRPADLVMFGGMWEFLPPFVPGIPGRGRSFLCGHCSTGFFFMSFFFLLSGWKRWTALATGVILGLLMGAARVLQGSHFTSDVLLCGGIMLAIPAALSGIARRIPSATRKPVSRTQVAAITLGVAALGVLVALLSAPVYKEERFVWRGPGNAAGIIREDKVRPWPAPGGRRVEVFISMKEGDSVVHISGPREPLTIHSTIKGFGFPGAWRKWDATENSGQVRWRLDPTGTYSEYNGRIDASFSPDKVSRLSLNTGGGAVAIRLGDYRGNISVFFAGVPAELPPGFARIKNGWKRPGNPELSPVNIDVTADSVSILP